MKSFKQNILKSFCKINLFLNVCKKDKKLKLHQIQSLIFICSLYDEIKIKKIFIKRDIINFHGKFAYQVRKDNSVTQSLELLRKKGYIKPENYYKISINKKIPAFSGLGGGSSNSATIVKYFSKNKNFTTKDLNFFSNSLGSDFRLFFYSAKIYQKSLKNIIQIKSAKRFSFLIIYPFFNCSTKSMYLKINSIKKLESRFSFSLNSNTKFIQSLKNRDNSFEKVAIKKYPKLKIILNEIRKIKNCEFSRLTGSGSACFGLFLTQKSANLAQKKIKKKFPKYWCVVCKTI